MRRFEDKRVSVIIPVYNVERYIGRTIDSVLAQEWKDIEIVLVDDCSEDNSAKIIQSYISGHSNIIYHLQEKNQGAAVARNKALELATGRYVAFLDGDDEWCHDKLKRQLSFMAENNAAISCTALDTIDESSKPLGNIRPVDKEISYSYLLYNTMMATSTVIVDRKITGDFGMPLRRGGQDYATWLMLMREGIKCYGLNEVLSHYRVLPNSLSSNKLKSIRQIWEIQTQNEKISKPQVIVHIIGFFFFAIKKRLNKS